MRRIAFVDRDGTLIEEPEDLQVDAVEKVKLMPGVIASLLRLVDAGYELVVVTNQDGLGTDSFPMQDYLPAQQHMMDLFSSQGITFSEVLVDDSFEDNPSPNRKPAVGLVLPLMRGGDLDYQRSFVVGDRVTDLQLAENMGVRGFRVGPEGQSWPEIVREVLDQPRTGSVQRRTSETAIEVQVDLDPAQPQSDIETGIGFFDHMLAQIAQHGGIDLQVRCIGDTHIDDHHTVEDCALALGEALNKALDQRRGIARYGFTLPMDETLAQCAIDLSGRPISQIDIAFTSPQVGQLSTEMIPHFFKSLAQSLGAAIHLNVRGDNNHHMAEGAFKAFARCLAQAIEQRDGAIPSSKGVL